MKIGVQKTLVAEDGMGNAYCKVRSSFPLLSAQRNADKGEGQVHCKKLPQAKDLVKEKHLAQHWVNMGSSRWVRFLFSTVLSTLSGVFNTVSDPPLLPRHAGVPHGESPRYSCLRNGPSCSLFFPLSTVSVVTLGPFFLLTH
jgi:hypothetical protein